MDLVGCSRWLKMTTEDDGGRQWWVTVPTFKGAVSKDYLFWKVRVTNYLKQQGLLHCLDRIPISPMEDCGDAPEGAAEEEERALLNEQYQRRLKEDDEVVNIFWTSLDNDAMAHVLECVYAKQILDRLDALYLRQGRLEMFSIRRQLYNLQNGGYSTLLELFMVHERYIDELERAGEVVSASEKVNTLLAAIPERHQNILDAIAVMRQSDFASISLAGIRSLFLDADKQREMKPSNEVMAAESKKKKKEKRTCFECGKVGHTMQYCYRLRNLEAVKRKHGSERGGTPTDQQRERAKIAPAGVSERENVPAEHKRRKVDYADSEREIFPAEYRRDKFKIERGFVASSERERVPAERTNGNFMTDRHTGKPQTIGSTGKKIALIVDSGASDHKIGDGMGIKDCRAVDPVTASTASDGQMLVGRKRGVVKLKSAIVKAGKINEYELYDVLFIPNLQCNLLSVSKLVSAGKRVAFDDRGVMICEGSGEMITPGKKVGGLFVGLFVLDTVVDDDGDDIAYIGEVDSPLDIWRKRVNHLGYHDLKKLVSQRMVDGLDFERPSRIQGKRNVCPPCVIGKHNRKPF